jgi:hypothetical protein
MAYAIVTKDNVSYQPRDNIIQLLRNNLTNSKVPIYDNQPDITARGFHGFPIIVLPEFPLQQIDDVTLKQNVQYDLEVGAELLHDKEKLGDNQARTMRQDIIKMFNLRANKKILAGYGVIVEDVEFGTSDMIATNIDQKTLVTYPFTLNLKIDVNMGA